MFGSSTVQPESDTKHKEIKKNDNQYWNLKFNGWVLASVCQAAKRLTYADNHLSIPVKAD